VPKKVIIKPGDKYGSLVVIQELPKRIYKNSETTRLFECKCDCGRTRTISIKHLRTKGRSNCICIRNKKLTTHGMAKTRLYKIYIGIKTRCYNKRHISYRDYGAKGIIMCDEWLDYENFFKDMGKDYKDGLSIERIDPKGNYESANCKWIPLIEQSKNKTNTIYVEYKKNRIKLIDLVKMFEINYNKLYERIFIYNKSVDEAVEMGK